MKRIFITLMLALSFLGLQAQTTTYYKNSNFKKAVPQNNAKYKIVRFTKNDTAVYKSYAIKGNQLLTVIKTLNGHATGIWYKYDKNGNLIYRDDFRPLFYSDAHLKGERSYNEPKAKDKSVTPAEFPGGIPELMKFLQTHIHYPAMSETMHHTGTVLIRFYIEKDGTAVPYSIMQGIDPFLDLAAWKVITEMPKWTPAQKNGKPVKELLHLPVKFLL